mmetsp:Transcript_56382/g.150816  ORF Transcript_56382/g.150816 Transcript_56382/m.150816 type:complete len:350 (-) Transcript_56382:532-1581(-)
MAPRVHTEAGKHRRDSNAVHVVFPRGAETDIINACRRFGEIASVDHLPGHLPAAIVVFHDVRAAAATVKALPRCCTLAPQRGTRTVQAPGNVEVDEALFPAISDIWSEGSFFYIEFFDVRDAHRFSQQVKADSSPVKPEGVPEASSFELSGLEPPPGLEMPRVRDTNLQVKLPADEKVRITSSDVSVNSVEVLLTGLPNALLEREMLEVVLDQSRLRDTVISFSTQKGRRTGEALVVMDSTASAGMCIQHFNGCQWDNRGVVVHAEIVTKAPHRTISSTKRGVWKDAPLFVPMCVEAPVATQATSTVKSETSTDVGDSSEEDDRSASKWTRSAALRRGESQSNPRAADS